MMAEHHKAIVIGGGISGLVTLKTLKQKGIDCVLYEANEYHGGLWHFSPNNYGVMEFTHINVSKYNYAFSDFPFPEETVDFPHHSAMAEYIDKYVEYFQLYNHIQYRTRVLQVSRFDMDEHGKKKRWRLCCDSRAKGAEFNVTCDYLIIATGHHAKPKLPEFPGQDNFEGTIIHSVDFKDVVSNGFEDKNVVVVGIGNSAVDVAVNCASRGRSGSVYLSTRSGAWVLPNYLFSLPIDLYASRFFLDYLPFSVKEFIMETVVRVLTGNPKKWNLNPKMGPLRTQPTVSPTLIHHIQRGNVQVMPNIREICEHSVRFHDGTIVYNADVIVNCTGYTVDLPYLPEEIADTVVDSDTNDVKLYKNVFNPDIGPQLAFIGFVQPSSGGILPISELQAQWLAMLIKGRATLPHKIDMKEAMVIDKKANRARFYDSPRHTIQQDPITYNDEIASFIGAKPELANHIALAPRLLFGSAGVAQWSLQGPFFNEKAERIVKKVPVPPFISFMALFGFVLLIYIVYRCFCTFCAMF